MANQYFRGFSDFPMVEIDIPAMLVKEPAEYPEPDEDGASNEAFLHQS
jgi:hypothetical protein